MQKIIRIKKATLFNRGSAIGFLEGFGFKTKSIWAVKDQLLNRFQITCF